MCPRKNAGNTSLLFNSLIALLLGARALKPSVTDVEAPMPFAALFDV